VWRVNGFSKKCPTFLPRVDFAAGLPLAPGRLATLPG
jgi:hypothetical protein